MPNIWEYEDDENTVLIGINPDSQNVVFPNKIKKIVDFSNTSSLLSQCQVTVETISFEADSELSYLGNYSFALSKITSVNLSNCLHLESISPGLFFRCNFLKTVVLPEGGKLKTICAGSFRVTSLTSIKIPDSVTTIEAHSLIYGGVFADSYKLTSIEISSNSQLTYIGYAIAQSTKVSSFFIPKCVSKISGGAFSWMAHLEKLIVDPDNQNFCSVDDIIYTDNNNTLHTCAPNKKTEIAILPTVKYFQAEAFRSCQMKCSIVIPESITELPKSLLNSAAFTSINSPQNSKK